LYKPPLHVRTVLYQIHNVLIPRLFLRDLNDPWNINRIVFCSIALEGNGVCVLTLTLTMSIGHQNKRVEFSDALVKS